MSHVAGIFYDPMTANHAISSLLSAGLSKDDISLLMSSDAKKNFTAATKDTGDRTVVDTAIGAGTGGVLGGLLAGLTTVAAVLIPGAQLMVVGPLVAVLGGIGGGAALGGLAGALSALGISAAESGRYEKELKEGKCVILVDAKESMIPVVRSILSAEGADRIKAA